VQGASAAHNAAAAQAAGYGQAATSVNNAVSNANPLITGAANLAGANVNAAAEGAGTGAVNAGEAAASGVNNAAVQANTGLSPYTTTGSTATGGLNNLIAAGGFQFNPSNLQNTPGYQFTQQQGLKGITNNASATGLLGSGSTVKAAANYTSNLASTTYNQQYQNALQGYNANLNTMLPAASMGLTAANTQGANLINAGMYGGSTNLGASEYAGSTGLAGAQYAGTAGMSAANTSAQNLINAGVYQGNTQIGAGNATAQGDIGAANQWNSMLGSIGTAANTALGMGFAPGGGGSWSPSNIGTNFGNMMGAANYGSTNPYTMPSSPYGGIYGVAPGSYGTGV
jgi:hypothetical protein